MLLFIFIIAFHYYIAGICFRCERKRAAVNVYYRSVRISFRFNDFLIFVKNNKFYSAQAEASDCNCSRSCSDVRISSTMFCKRVNFNAYQGSIFHKIVANHSYHTQCRWLTFNCVNWIINHASQFNTLLFPAPYIIKSIIGDEKFAMFVFRITFNLKWCTVFSPNLLSTFFSSSLHFGEQRIEQIPMFFILNFHMFSFVFFLHSRSVGNRWFTNYNISRQCWANFEWFVLKSSKM